MARGEQRGKGMSKPSINGVVSPEGGHEAAHSRQTLKMHTKVLTDLVKKL